MLIYLHEIYYDFIVAQQTILSFNKMLRLLILNNTPYYIPKISKETNKM